MNDFIQASDTDVIFVESPGNYAVSPLHFTEDLNVADGYLNVHFQSSSMTLPDYSDTSDVVTVFTGDIGIDEQNLNYTLPLSPEPIVPHKKNIVVHRGQILFHEREISPNKTCTCHLAASNTRICKK